MKELKFILTQNFPKAILSLGSMISNAPSSSSMDSIVNPKVKTTKGKGVGERSLARSTLGVEGHVGAPG
jgi:hypothetical protein